LKKGEFKRATLSTQELFLWGQRAAKKKACKKKNFTSAERRE
jgi:hypothetical protein